MPSTIEISHTVTIKYTSTDPEVQTLESTQKDPSIDEMAPPFVPTSMSAIESNKLSILYYARPTGELASLTAQKSGEDPSNESYKSANIILNGNTVSAAVPQVSAVSYRYNGNREVPQSSADF